MKEKIISFETAKLTKEKGFESILSTYYDNTGMLISNKVVVTRKLNKSRSNLGADTINDFEGYLAELDNSLEDFYLAPTQSLLQKWLRDVHNIHCFADCVNGIGSRKGWFFDAQIPFTNKHLFPHSILIDDNNNTITYDTYEEALEKGLQEALKLLP